MASTSSEEDPVKNALENYLIVKKVLELSDPKDRLKLRLVSKYFDMLAIEVIRATGYPTVRQLKSNTQLNQFVTCVLSQNRANTHIPFTAFTLNLAQVTAPVISKLATVLNKLTSLTLEMNSTMPKIEGGLTLTINILPSCDPGVPVEMSNNEDEGQMAIEVSQLIMDKATMLLCKGSLLVHLTLDFPNYCLGRRAAARLPTFRFLKNACFCYWRIFPNFPTTLFGEILKRSPNLNHLHVKFDFALVNERWDVKKRLLCRQIPLILFGYCQRPPQLSIEHAATCVDGIMVLNEIVATGFNKVRYLDFNFDTFTHMRTMYQPFPLWLMKGLASCLTLFLTLQCDFLTSLRLSLSSRGQWDNCMQIVIPKLNKLQELEINCSNYLQLEVQRNLRPLQPFETGQFPVLKKLNFFTQRYELGLFVNSPQFPSVEFLGFEIFNTPIETIPLGVVFPNVKQLSFYVFPPIATVEEVLSNLINLEDLTFGSHPTEFLTESECKLIWESYTGGAGMLTKEKLTELFHQNGPNEVGMNESGSGVNELCRGFGNLRKLKRLAIPLESVEEFYAILWLLNTEKFSELKELVIHNEPPEIVLRTPKHQMKFEDESVTFIDAVQRAITFA